MNTLTILVMGKGGVGKSSTVNSILGERAVTVNAFQVFVTVNLGFLALSNLFYFLVMSHISKMGTVEWLLCWLCLFGF